MQVKDPSTFARKARLATGLSVIALTAVSSPAFTQSVPTTSPAESDATTLEEIVVTAQRRAENLQKVPIAITAVTAQDLTVAGTTSVLQLERVAPGLQTYQVAATVLPFIRGIGSSQSPPGFESPIAIYIDGVYQGSKGGNVFDLGNIERIEVLKGPQGTLFGRNATGGAISIITADPKGEPFVNAEAGYGRFNEKRAKIYAGGSITDTLAVGIAASGRWDDGYIFNTVLNKNQNPATNITVLGKMVWSPTDAFKARLSAAYSYFSDATGLSPHVKPGTVSLGTGAPGSLTPTYGPYTTTADHPTVIKFIGERYTLNLNYDLGNADLVSITGYIKGSSPALNTTIAAIPINNIAGSYTVFDQFSQELQLQSAPGRLTYILGLYYMSLSDGFGAGADGQNQISGGLIPSPVRPADLGPSYGGTGPSGANAFGFSSAVKTRAYAAFAQGTYKITDELRLTAGVRYSSERKQLVGTSYFYLAVPGATNTNIPLFNSALGGDGLVFGTRLVGTADVKKTFSKPTFRLALDYQINPDVLIYASYNTGFKSGTYNPSVVSNTQVPVTPEFIDAYEIGIKSEFFNRRVRLNAAAYYYDYRDIQVGLITGSGISTVQNAASARNYGFDAELTAIVTNSFTLRGGVSYINSKYKNYSNAQVFLPRIAATPCSALPPAVTVAQATTIAATTPAPGATGNCSYSLNASGQPLIFAPKWSGNIAGDYNIDLGGPRLLLNGSLYFNSGFDVVPGGLQGHIGSYQTLTASATYYAADDRYFARIWGDNLTNNDHAIYISPQSTGFQQVRARPISYGVTLGFKI